MAASEIFACSHPGCAKIFNERRRLTQHQKSHSRPSRCETCSKGFASRTDLARHISTVHRIGKAIFTCDVSRCKFTSKRKDNFVQHIQTVHNNHALRSIRTKNVDELLTANSDDEKIVLNAGVNEIRRRLGWPLFMEAASTGNISLMDDLIQRGLDVNVKAEDGYSALHCAARSGQIATISYLLEEKAVIDSPNVKVKGRRPIHEAILGRHHEAIALLQTAGADVWSPDDHNRTIVDYMDLAGNDAASMAVFQKAQLHGLTLEIATLLVRASSRSGNSCILAQALSKFPEALFEHNNMTRSPIIVASSHGHKEVLAVLLASGEALKQSRDAFKRRYIKFISSSLGPATQRGHLDIVKRLIECEGIDVNLSCGWREGTALKIAAEKGDTKIAEVLLRHHKTDVNLPSGSSSITALYAAAKQGDTCMVALLLQHNDINVNSRCGAAAETALHVAVIGGHLEFIQLLLSHPGIDAQSKTHEGSTPLATALSHRKWKALQLLARHQGHNINIAPLALEGELPRTGNASWLLDLLENLLQLGLISSKSGIWRSVMEKAVKAGTIEVVEFLHDRLDFDINQFVDTKTEATTLSIAAEYHRHDVIRFCLDNTKIDVNRSDPGFWSVANALHCAVHSNCMVSVRLLLSHPEINLTLRDWYGHSALELARILERHEMVELLVRHGAAERQFGTFRTQRYFEREGDPDRRPCSMFDENGDSKDSGAANTSTEIFEEDTDMDDDHEEDDLSDQFHWE